MFLFAHGWGTGLGDRQKRHEDCWLVGEPIVGTDPSVSDVFEVEVVVPWGQKGVVASRTGGACTRGARGREKQAQRQGRQSHPRFSPYSFFN
eukprot:scaffold42526_cov298-Isochrysis_galbana.AAC.2